MAALAYLLALVSLILNITLFIRLRPPYNFMILWLPQLVQHALSPFLVMMGLVGACLGWLSNAPLAVISGLVAAAISAVYVWQVLRQQADFTQAFGADWATKIPTEQQQQLLHHRWQIGLPSTDTPRWEHNVPFWTIPASDRQLLCDVWQPAATVRHSGTGIIFLHGSGWYLSDKDFGTRPFFRQLTTQGHVVMDVAYRLCPEVDIFDMVGDVKRAVAWLKTNAHRYQIDPSQIVLIGASAGGHLALHAAYAPYQPRFTPADVSDCDLSVRAVISNYGPTDLSTVYKHTEQTRTLTLPKVVIGQPGAASKEINLQDAGRLDALLGGHLHEIPDIYALASPVTHVHADCPPTLLIHCDLDCITPTAAIRDLHQKLVSLEVPAILVVYPLTQHAFDLLLPQVSPPAQASLYEIERFLALVATDTRNRNQMATWEPASSSSADA